MERQDRGSQSVMKNQVSAFKVLQDWDQWTGKIVEVIVMNLPLRMQLVSRQANDNLIALTGKVLEFLQLKKYWLTPLCFSGARKNHLLYLQNNKRVFH
jgi:hypothetical protein